jgi:hypothetical protein
VHRTRQLPEAELHRVGSPPCTTPARSVVDAAQWASSPDEARLIIAAAFQQRLVSGDDLGAVLRQAQRLRRRSLIVRTVADADAGSHTLAELDLVILCRRAGLPVPSRQVLRVDSEGRKRYLDAFFDEWSVHVEVDGKQHVDIRQYWEDMRRQNALAAHRLQSLRFPSFVIREQPDYVRYVVGTTNVTHESTSDGCVKGAKRTPGRRPPKMISVQSPGQRSVPGRVVSIPT